MKFPNYIILLLCLFSASLSCYGQVKNIGLPEVRNYKKLDYRAGTQNWCMDQDANGNMYFANNNGLLQYDGASWRRYALRNTVAVRSLRIDSLGRIYVGGYDEFGYYKANRKGKLEYFSISKLLESSRIKSIDFIWKIHLYQDEVIFQSFSRAYIYKSGKLKILNPVSRFQFSYVVNNQLIFQDKEAGLLEYVNGGLRPLKGTTILNSTEVWGIFPLSNQQLLIGTLDKGMFLYSEGTLSPWKTEANQFMLRNSCLGGVMVGKNNIALNSVLDGIIICDLNGKIIQHINYQQGLQNNTVLSSFIDNKKNLWLGLDNGIAFVNENSPFSFFGFSYNLSTVYASVIHQGNLYVATNQGLFYHSWNSSFRDGNFKIVAGTTGQAWNIQVVNGQLICGHNRGALLISGAKVVKVLSEKGHFGFKSVPNQPNYLVGSTYSGFTLFENSETGYRFKNAISGFDLSVNTFEIDQNNLWLKKDNLMYQLAFNSDLTQFHKVKSYSNFNAINKGIGSVQLLNGIVYFQNKNRFYRFSEEQSLFYEDSKISKIFQYLPQISALSQDKYGNVWYFYKESLGVLRKQNGGGYKNEMAAFSNLSGNLVSNYMSINVINPSDILIGLTDGLAHYNATITNNALQKPQAFIRSFSYPEDTILFGNGGATTESITIPFRANRVRFTFSSPIYENLENVEFSYQLEGFDERWSNWSNSSIKEYTNLREGSYTMNLKVRNSNGIESQVVKVHFSVAPPWYRHALAYLLYVLLFVGCVFFVRNRIQVKIRKNKYYETIEQRRLYLEREAKIRQEQYDLEKEIEKLKNDKLKIKILAKDKELVNNSLQVVKKNKILNGIIHKLKDINADAFDESTKFQFSKLNKSIVKEVNADKSWKDLEKHIKNVHFDFLKRLKEQYPTISPRELDLSTYLLMNMSTKEIAEIMNISTGGVELARYRLRKKLGLNKKENLTGFLMSI